MRMLGRKVEFLYNDKINKLIELKEKAYSLKDNETIKKL
jgi:hypothetical protein